MSNTKSLEQIFEQTNASDIAFDLRHYLSAKRFSYKQPLTQAELMFDVLVRMGGEIASDGFICLFHERYGPEFFSKICDALTEVGGTKLRDLLREAWSIYTKGKEPITVDELHAISVRRFNTRELMDRFDAIGEEVVGEIHEQHATGKVWSVEYAKRHRNEFQPIEGLTLEQRPAMPQSPPPLPANSQPLPSASPYLSGHKFRNPISRQVKHPKDIFAIKSEYQFLLALTLHGMVKQYELGLKLNHAERTLALLASLASECYEDPVEKWLKGWTAEDLKVVSAAMREGGAFNTIELLEQAKYLLSGNPSGTKELARINKELHGASVAAELHKAQVAYARAHQTDFGPVEIR